jgi:Apc13p protein
MPQASDSNFSAVTRHRRPYSTAGRPPVIDLIDDDWAADRLGDDDVEIQRHEAAVAPLLEEGELDADAIVVSPSGNSSAVTNSASERRRREEGWTDLGLDQLDGGHHHVNPVNPTNSRPSTSTTSNNTTPAG